MSLDALPPLREVTAAFGLEARKRFGQHYLFDLNLTAKIARLGGDLTGMAVIEVGPGPGGLTRALAAAGADPLIAIEADTRFAPALEAIAAAAAPGAVTPVFADALSIDEPALLARYASNRPAAVIANLPYNVGTALLIKWLTAQPVWWSRLVLMFQKEVAQRIVAEPGSPAYGRLAVLRAATALARWGLDAPARAFTPPPKVDSAVVVLEPRAQFDALEPLARVTEAAFGQRRKMLRASLKGLAGAKGLEAEAWITAAGLRPDQRPETVPPEGFFALTRAWLSA
ncbi:MAG: 16S rRNA (adenine(1518)-N(6)/adenine(1519)-N(6))-dimethyltransferase RsmA [Maricaulaceae bacterium]